MIESKESSEDHAEIDESLKVLLERVPLGITLSRGDSLLYVNRAYLSMLRYCDRAAEPNAPMLIDLTPQWRRIVHANGHSHPSTLKNLNRHESRGQLDDGSTFQFQIELGCINFQNGMATVAFITDITEPNKMKAEIQELAPPQSHLDSAFDLSASDQLTQRQELQRSSDTAEILPSSTTCSQEKEGPTPGKSESGVAIVPEAIIPWLECIAHDFNNLLTLIQVNASTLLAEKKLDKELADSAEQIYRAVDKAANLTSKLLTYGRREQG
jgi:hypothetical protein